MKRTYVVALFAVISFGFFPAAGSAAVTPDIFYSDLQSGPSSGGQNGQGVFVTICGVGFGSSQGTSRVTIGGVPAVGYLLWSDTKIAFQVGANAVTGGIVVQVNGVNSNAVQFTVGSGNIYFVSPNGSDQGAGSFSDPWQTVSHALNRLVSGDTVYLMDGVQQDGIDSNNAALSLTLAAASGSRIAIVAYPGASATIGSLNGGNYGIYASNAARWVIAGLQIRGSQEALHLKGSGGWRIVGDDISCPNASSAGGCVDGTSSGNAKLYGNNIHDSGVQGAALGNYDSVVFTDSNTLDIGWNEVARTNACNAIHTVSTNIIPTNISVHDNWIHDSVCAGISLPTVDDGTTSVRVFNNVIARAGTGPSPSGNATLTCVTVGDPWGSAALVQNNTLHDCGAAGGNQSGAISIGMPTSFDDNVVDLVGGETYISPASDTSGTIGNNDLFYGAGAAPDLFSYSLSADPQFVDPVNDKYQLQSSSPAIDTGTSTANKWDILGVSRPQGQDWDIGAYEFTGTPSGGNGTQATLATTQTSLSFGNVNTGSATTLTVTLSNTGGGSMSISQLSVSGAGFSVSGFTTPATLAAGAAATLSVSFAPSSATSYSGTLSITSNASNSILTIPLSGTGVQASQAQLTANPASINFGSVNTGSSSTQTITLSNTGNASATINLVSESGSGFSLGAFTSPYTLAVGATVSLNVIFSPTVVNTSSGTVTVNSNAANSTLSIPLSGSGTQGTQTQTLAATPTGVNFTTIAAGNSVNQSLTLTNNGASSVSITQVTTTGTGFSVSDIALPYSLAPGASVTVEIRFAPLLAGSYSGLTTITSNASNSSLTVPLSGAATHSVGLSWTDGDSGLSGFNVYRGSQSGGPYIKMNSSGVLGTSWSDGTVQAGQTYYYVITAVSSSGVESAYSTQVSATVPNP